MLDTAQRVLELEQELRAALEDANLFEIVCQVFFAATALAVDLSPAERVVLGHRLSAMATQFKNGETRIN